MVGDFRQAQTQQQVQKTTLRQIMVGTVLQMPALELEQYIERVFEENPALLMDESPTCPACDTVVRRFPCPVCGHRPDCADDVPTAFAEDWHTMQDREAAYGDLEAFAGIAVSRTMQESLTEQWSLEAGGAEREVGDYIIGVLDRDGYLHDDLFEVASRHGMSVPQAEAVLRRIQALDPPGVGARGLRECLLLQCARYEGCERLRDLSMSILRDHFDLFADGKLKAVAKTLHCTPEAVEEAADWMRRSLTPFPGQAYHREWQELTPVEEARVTPDVVIRRTAEGFVVQITEASRRTLRLDTEMDRMVRALPNAGRDADDGTGRLRRAVTEARFIVEAIRQRKRTLHQVMSQVVREQVRFLESGPAHLKPLMRKTIAEQLKVHESTVSRALADKMVRLPTGETVEASSFFDASLAAKDALAEMIQREPHDKPLSDSQLAEMLATQGYTVARRTVAKYRDALKIPPVDVRRGR